ncbi:MAG: thermonuclease family protein, partial [Planctomycetaceae bacterium]|nr:thermonuclease family protein [Planctomycetaceae bacterium]
ADDSAITTPPADIDEFIIVQRVVDGDTLKADDGRRVRLIGVNSPELAHDGNPVEFYAVEATEWLRKRVEGKKVGLRKGPDELDQYGRTLAFVYDEHNALINLEILAQGNARLLDRFGLPADLEPALRQAASEAKLRKIGMWGPADQRVDSR